MSRTAQEAPRASTDADPSTLLRPRREIAGSSAMLLPFTEGGAPDWDSYRRHLARTFEADLAPAVNMDTGYANLIDEDTRRRVLAETEKLADGRAFVAGAFVSDETGDAFDLGAYRRQIEQIEAHAWSAVRPVARRRSRRRHTDGRL